MHAWWMPGCCLQALVDGKNFPDAILDFNATLALLQRDPSADVARARLLSGALLWVLAAGSLLADRVNVMGPPAHRVPLLAAKLRHAGCKQCKCWPPPTTHHPLPLYVQAGAWLTRAWETGWQPWQTMTRHWCWRRLRASTRTLMYSTAAATATPAWVRRQQQRDATAAAAAVPECLC